MSIHKVSADNECFFNAIAYGILYLSTQKSVTIKQYKPLAKRLRKNTVKVLENKINSGNIDAIIVMAAEMENSNSNNNVNLNDEKNLKKLINKAKLYTKKMSKRCTWGGHIELQAISSIVHSYGFRGVKVYDACTKSLLMQSVLQKNKKPIIHIILHDVNMGGSHFDFWEKKQKGKYSNSSSMKFKI
jgi:hypothetical protein